jgi:hypothetical protein
MSLRWRRLCNILNVFIANIREGSKLMQQGPSWEADSRSAGMDVLLWNRNSCYRTHKSPPLDPILKQLD